jgi:O-antigen/teichoic acid export membrane protein
MQNSTTIKIGKKDVAWNYLATFLQIGSGILLFPFILRMLSAETVGMWAIFTSIATFVNLLDFGFSPSFTRNITYIFSGVSKLEKTGICNNTINSQLDINLLAKTIRAMKWYYLRIAIIAFALLITVGSGYLFYITTNNYSGDKLQIAIAWIIFCITNTYNIYTLYYDSLLLGFGLIMRDKQLIIISQIINLTISITLIYLGFGLISIVAAQAISIIVKRILSNNFFYTEALKQKLAPIKTDNFKDILAIIKPNSIKLGLTSVGAFLVLQSSVIIGAFFVSLHQLASYGITVQVIGIIASLGTVYYTSYIPQIAYLRVNGDVVKIKSIYRKCVGLLIITFIGSGVILILFGNLTLSFLKSQTPLLSSEMICAILVFTFLEKNHAIAGGFLLSKNEVPFFKAAMISGAATVLVLFILFQFGHLELWGMILAPGIVQLVYQNWKWPQVLLKELNHKN